MGWWAGSSAAQWSQEYQGSSCRWPDADYTRGGCLRIGHHSGQAYYILERAFIIQREKLDKTALVVLNSPRWMRVCAAKRRDVNQIICLGRESIRIGWNIATGSVKYYLHYKWQVNSPRGGNVEKMNIGKFLHCQCRYKKSTQPDPTVRCACEFEVEKSLVTKQTRNLLDCRCKKK